MRGETEIFVDAVEKKELRRLVPCFPLSREGVRGRQTRPCVVSTLLFAEFEGLNASDSASRRNGHFCADWGTTTLASSVCLRLPNSPTDITIETARIHSRTVSLRLTSFFSSACPLTSWPHA